MRTRATVKFLESLYIKAFINIVVDKKGTTLYVETYKKEKLHASYEEHFNVFGVDEKIIEYIHNFTKETPFFYIAYLDNSTQQGALPTCLKSEMSRYYDLSESEYKCVDKKWTYYTSKTDLYELEKIYEKIGLDFIFSPFALVSNFFKDKLEVHFAGYILLQEDLITLSIFENATLLYAESINVESYVPEEILEEPAIEDEEDLDIVEEIEEGIDLDDISAIDELDSLDDFGDIADLDSLDDIDNFSQEEDIEEEFNEEVAAITQGEGAASEDEDLVSTEDYQRFTLIQESINRYYHDDRYDSKFLETLYIADGVGVSSMLKQYFEEEMFLSVYVRSIDIAQELSQLALEEVIS